MESRTGEEIRVGFEPEPGCVVERTEQAVSALAGFDPAYFGVCVDTAHLAVAHEDPGLALKMLDDAGIPVVKLQASAALEAARPGDPLTREALARFVEPRYLHQTREAGGSGAGPGPRPGLGPGGASRCVLQGTDDLDEALDGVSLPGVAPWRVHFHVRCTPRLRRRWPVRMTSLFEP